MKAVGPVLVTGAYGLIGHAVTLALKARGMPVVPTDLLAAPPVDAEFDAQPLEIRGVEALSCTLAGHRVDAIVHAAGVSGPMLGRSAPHHVLDTNICGTLDLFEAARLAGVRRVVVLSSAAAYGATGDKPVTEATPLAAADVYGASKIAGELVARAYAARHGVEAVILRPSWVYGPRRRTPCVIRAMVADALAGQPTHMAYGGGFPRQFVHANDVARAVVSSIAAPGISGMAFNIADGTREPLDAVAAMVKSMLLGATITLEPGPDPDDVFLGPMDISSAKQHLHWTPAIGLKEGIKNYIEYLEHKIG
jgi:UDP-glucuronate 4-epimerase